MATGRGANGPSKKDRREQAREHARLMREEAQRKARRRKWWIQGSVGVAIIAVLAVISLVIVNAVQPPGPGPKNMISDGIVLTSTTKAVRTPALAAGEKPTPTTQSDTKSKAYITIYSDYQCPYCDQFETANISQIGKWVDGGIAQLELHPISLPTLDQESQGTHYSRRAANAGACVANYDPDDYFAFNTAMFKNQPTEGSAGLTDAKILSIMKGAGVHSSAVTSCVKDQKFSSWVNAASTRALDKPIPNSSLKSIQGTPTVLVNGKQYNGSYTDASAFQSFVESVMSAEAKTSTSTPTPAPTATK